VRGDYGAMRYSSLKDFLARSEKVLAKGPIALIFVEDEVEVASTLRHHLGSGFGAVLAFMPAAFDLEADLAAVVHRIDHDTLAQDMLTVTVNALIAEAPGTWFYYCYNAEYLFYPFCESRTVAEMLAFHTEERRDAMLCYVVDLYAGDLTAHPSAVSLEDAHLDKSGYYALARVDADNHNHPRGSWISLAGCAGAMRSISPRRGARSTGWRCSGPSRGWSCARRIRSMTRNTTPMPAPGITTSRRRSVPSARPRR